MTTEKLNKTNHYLFVELENVSRKVTLQALTTDPGSSLVIDFMRRLFPITVGNVVLPYYPVVNDMVMVREAVTDDVWRVRVVAYNLPRKFVLGRCFEKEDEIWIPEQGTHNRVSTFH